MRRTVLTLLTLVCCVGRNRALLSESSGSSTEEPLLYDPTSELRFGEEAQVQDDWVDLAAESEDVRVAVQDMILAMPSGMRNEVTRMGRKRVVSQLCVIFARAVIHDRQTPFSELTNLTTHVIGAGTTQIYKTFMPATAALAGKILRCPVGIVTKGCDNQRDLTDKIVGGYLQEMASFRVAAMSCSKASRLDIMKNFSTTTYVMASTEPQIRAFLEAMADLQLDIPERGNQPVKGWILVYDESDALKTTLDSSNLYEQALDAIAGNHSYRYTASNGVADLVLHRPSVTLHETATPQPTMTRLRKICNVQPEHFFKLEAFPNYISKKDYHPLKGADGKDLWLADGDLCVGNLFAKHDKARLWVRDLADTRNGIGIYIANSRVRVDKSNIHTAWQLRKIVKESHPDLPMVFGAYSAGLLRWYRPGHVPEMVFAGEAKPFKPRSRKREGLDNWTRGEYQSVKIGKNRAKGCVSFGEAVDQMAATAGSASVCVVAYSARRNVTWRTSRNYHSPRCQTHICNALPKTWDMPNYAQGNGRATGDSKELLESSTREPGAPEGSGRSHITFLGHRWDHEADLSTEAWVDEVAARMHGPQRMSLVEATDAELHPFDPICNFNIGRDTRQPGKNRKTYDRRLIFEHKYTDEAINPDGLGYRLVLSSPDPREAEAAEHLDKKKTSSRYLRGTTPLISAAPSDPVLEQEDVLVGFAEEVAQSVADDRGRSLDMFALPEAADAADLSDHLPQVLQGEGQEPVLITEYKTLTMADLQLDLSWNDAEADMQQQPETGRIAQAVQRHHGCGGVRFCFMHRCARLTRDVRALDDQPFNVAWRAYGQDGQAMVASIRFRTPLPGPSSTTMWLRDTLQQPAYQQRRVVWHTFDNLPQLEVKGNQSVKLTAPCIKVVTRGPLAGDPFTAPSSSSPKRKRSSLTMSQIITAKLITPGRASITTTYKGVTHTADLTDAGTIHFAGNDYQTPTAFRSSITKRHCKGWDEVLYRGTKLREFRAVTCRL